MPWCRIFCRGATNAHSTSIYWGTATSISRPCGWRLSDVSYELGAFDDDSFATSTGKVELYSERLDALGLDPLPDYVAPSADAADAAESAAYPLVLLTGLREKTYHHSRFRDQAWARKVSPDPLIHIHPETASEHAITDGQWLTVHTSGTNTGCQAKAQVSEAAPKGVVATGMGWWDPFSRNPERGACDININGAMSYGGPWDRLQDRRILAAAAVNWFRPPKSGRLSTRSSLPPAIRMIERALYGPRLPPQPSIHRRWSPR